MTEPSELPPAQEVVRRLLAEARHDTPIPADVSARLDDTLARLHAERATDRSSATVVDLSSRRRRWAATGLLAAAAVVVAGFAVGQMLPGSSDDSTSSADSSGSAASSRDEVTTHPLTDESAPREDLAQDKSLKSTIPRGSGGPAITLDGDLVDTLVVLRTESVLSSFARSEADRARCIAGPIGPGVRVDVQVDDMPGLVIYRPRRGEEQVADVFVCGNPSPVRTLTLPAP